MSDVLLLQRNERAATGAERAEHAYWLADKEEAELMFNTLRALTVQLYRGSSLSHVLRDLDGVSVPLTDDEAAADHVNFLYERWQDTLDPVSIERFKRFGWPEFAPGKEGSL